MSNIFNDEGVRTSVAEYLKRDSRFDAAQGHLLSIIDIILGDPQIPQGSVTWSNFHEKVKELRLPTYRAIGIPENIELPLNTEGLASQKLVEYIDDPDKIVNLPLGDREFIPKYSPSHKTESLNMGILNACAYHTAMRISKINSSEEKTRLIEQVTELLEVASATRFSTGTLEGQLTRLKQGVEVRNGQNGHHKNKTLKEMGASLPGLVSLLHTTLPLKDQDPDYALIRKISGYIYNEEEKNYLGRDTDIPKLKMANAAGLPYLGKKKGEVLLENLVLADNFVSRVSKIISESTTSKIKKGTLEEGLTADSDLAKEVVSREIFKVLTTDYWYMQCGLLFPKGERYDVNSIDKKTRNIWSASTVTHLIAAMVSDQPVTRSLNFLNSKTFTPSLSKLTLTQGGMDKFIEKLLKAKDILHLIYADNIYMYYPESDEWFSVDLTKGEANATKEMAVAVAIYLLANGWTDSDGNPLFNLTWWALATLVIPNCVVDSMALLRNVIFKNPGQGSGNSWTFLINHACSTLLVQEWMKQGKPKPSDSAAMEKIMAKTGIDFKVELEVKDFKKKLLNLKDNPVNITQRRVRDVVELDLLGWDTTYTEFGYTAVLNKNRFFKSLSCPQPPSSKFEDPLAKSIHKYVQTFALMTLGSWVYPGIHSAVKELVENYATEIKRRIDEEDVEGRYIRLVKKFTEQSGYADILQLFDPQMPLHQQDWVGIVYAHRDIEEFIPKSESIRRIGSQNIPSNIKERTSRLVRLRNSGLMVGPSWDKMRSAMTMVYPGLLDTEIKDSKNESVGTNALKLMHSMYTQLTLDNSPQLIRKLWSQLYLREQEVSHMLIKYPTIPYSSLLFMSFLPPPPVKEALTSEVVSEILGWEVDEIDQTTVQDYIDELDEPMKIGRQAWQHQEATLRALSAYVNKSEIVLSALRGNVVFDIPTPMRAKNLEEIKNPHVAFKYASGLDLGALAARTGNKEYGPRPVNKLTKTQKRRQQRKK